MGTVRPYLLALCLAVPAAAAVVDGVVLDQLKQEPLRRAIVTLVSQDGGGRYVTASDPEGRFRL